MDTKKGRFLTVLFPLIWKINSIEIPTQDAPFLVFVTLPYSFYILVTIKEFLIVRISEHINDSGDEQHQIIGDFVRIGTPLVLFLEMLQKREETLDDEGNLVAILEFDREITHLEIDVVSLLFTKNGQG